MDIDLSDLLSGGPYVKPQPKVASLHLAPQHVTCTQCHGSGKYARVETHTIPLTEEAERTLETLGKLAPVQTSSIEIVKCLRCHGHGSYYMSNDVRARSVVMFWTRSICRCGAEYEGPAHVNSCMIRSDIYRPTIFDGVHKGWRYIETVYRPSPILPIHQRLPMAIEYMEYHIEVCRKCVREQLIICLPASQGEPA